MSDQETPMERDRDDPKAEARQYLKDIYDMQESYVMSEEEVAYFRAQRSTPFVPLTPDQASLLPSREVSELKAEVGQ